MREEKEQNEKTHIEIWILRPNLIRGDYERIYQGKFLIYATCPLCKRNICVSENRTESELQPVELEVPMPGADTPMTEPISTKKNIDVAASRPRNFPKKVFCISGKTIIVIHEELVKLLGINEKTWFQEEVTENGILLRVINWSDKKGSGGGTN